MALSLEFNVKAVFSLSPFHKEVSEILKECILPKDSNIYCLYSRLNLLKVKSSSNPVDIQIVSVFDKSNW